ncbi:MAG: lipid-A-disaccharide synthase [Planctomycetota bacterium]|jgi:lipid-A-disaccharide synthase
MSEGGQPRSVILFTAFEPSGDALAAPVVEELCRHREWLEVHACGGSRMEAAGATLLERTADGGSMGLNALRRGLAVRRQIGRITSWARGRRVVAHVAVDSPAANFPIAKAMRAGGVHVVHLVAPQIWAWARWRIRKLRRLTSLVLCVLPFEEQWFCERKVPAKFIGHPAINRTMREQMHGLPQGAPRLGIFPGSRGHEVRANTRHLVEVYAELQARHAGMCGVIVAANPELARIIRRLVSVFPTGLHMITGSADAVIAWCDLAVAVSGTITLDIAAHRKPMIGVYRTGLSSWILAKLLIRSPHRLLPNIIAEREIVPEFVPYLGGPARIVKQASRLLLDSKHGAVQSEELHRVCLRFANHDPAIEAARAIIELVCETPA